MDGDQFDAVTRRLATGTNRRQALRLGGGGLAAALLTLTGLREAAADDTPKPLGKKCRKDAQCASGYCAPDTSTCATPPGTSVTGELTETDPLLGDPCIVERRYDAYTFAHPGGDLSLSVRGFNSGGGTLPDPLVILFPGGEPIDTCTFITFNDDTVCGSDTSLDAYLVTTQPAGTYTAVVMESTNQPGTYTFARNTFSSPCPA
jgi:hypothetical protein